MFRVRLSNANTVVLIYFWFGACSPHSIINVVLVIGVVKLW